MNARDIIFSFFALVVIVSGLMFGYPKYKVWKAEQDGKA